MDRLGDLDPDAFYTPEFLAPILGYTKTELRRYCRESGINTRLSKNRVALDVEQARQIKAWVKDRNRPTPEEEEIDPFAA
jgi:hypothetical protein